MWYLIHSILLFYFSPSPWYNLSTLTQPDPAPIIFIVYIKQNHKKREEKRNVLLISGYLFIIPAMVGYDGIGIA